MVGWHHRLDGHEFEQVPGDGENRESLVRFSPRGHKELDMTGRLNNNNNEISISAEDRWDVSLVERVMI